MAGCLAGVAKQKWVLFITSSPFLRLISARKGRRVKKRNEVNTNILKKWTKCFKEISQRHQEGPGVLCLILVGRHPEGVTNTGSPHYYTRKLHFTILEFFLKIELIKLRKKNLTCRQLGLHRVMGCPFSRVFGHSARARETVVSGRWQVSPLTPGQKQLLVRLAGCWRARDADLSSQKCSGTGQRDGSAPLRLLVLPGRACQASGCWSRGPASSNEGWPTGQGSTRGETVCPIP